MLQVLGLVCVPQESSVSWMCILAGGSCALVSGGPILAFRWEDLSWLPRSLLTTWPLPSYRWRALNLFRVTGYGRPCLGTLPRSLDLPVSQLRMCWLLIARSRPLLEVAIFSKQEYFILSGKLYLFPRQLSLIDGNNLQLMTDWHGVPKVLPFAIRWGQLGGPVCAPETPCRSGQGSSWHEVTFLLGSCPLPLLRNFPWEPLLRNSLILNPCYNLFSTEPWSPWKHEKNPKYFCWKRHGCTYTLTMAPDFWKWPWRGRSTTCVCQTSISPSQSWLNPLV